MDSFPHDEAPFRVKLSRKRLFLSVFGFLLIRETTGIAGGFPNQ